MSILDPCTLLRRLAEESVESQWLEFKIDNAFPDEIGEYISALANGALLSSKDRAFLVFGVDDSRKMVGTSVRLLTKKVGNESLANWLGRLLFPAPLLNMLDFECNGKQFSIVEIVPSHRRPVRFKKIEYLRVGEHKKRAKDHPELEEELWNLSSKRSFEESLAQMNARLDTVFEVLDVDAMFANLNAPRPDSEPETARWLVRQGMIVDSLDGTFHITNLGAALLARNLKDFPAFFAKPVRFIRYVNNDKAETVADWQDTRGYAVCFHDVLKRIKTELPFTEVQIEGIRQTIPNYPMPAIREILANSLIHQDFSIQSAGPLVEFYNGRIEFTNPGGSLVEAGRIIVYHESRNRRMADAMYQMGICEMRGAGLKIAVREIERAHLPAPEFHSSSRHMNVVLYGPREFAKMTKEDRMRACFHHCVVCWKDKDPMSNASLRQRFGLPKSKYVAVSIVIRDCIEANVIARANPNEGNRSARYIPIWAARQDTFM